MPVFAWLGEIPLGSDNALTGPVSDSQSWGNSIHEHKVVRGKPVPQHAGEELDTRSLSFHFDESFCSPQAEYSRLRAARSSGSVMPFIAGNGSYDGKHYQIKSIGSEIKKVSRGGRIVRLEATIELIEVPGAAFSIGSIGGLVGSAVATAARAVLNPLIKRS